MKDLYSEVYKDFKNGAIAWSDISISYIQSQGGRIIDKVINSADEYYKKIKKTVFKEISNDLDILKKEMDTAEDYLSQIFRSIIGKP